MTDPTPPHQDAFADGWQWPPDGQVQIARVQWWDLVDPTWRLDVRILRLDRLRPIRTVHPAGGVL